MSTPKGQQIGDYHLESMVAQGGMGEIWRAVDTRTGKIVAVKRVRLERGIEKQRTFSARLLREAQALSRLRHENIVRCLDSGLDDSEQPYIVLEWLEGENLLDRHQRCPLNLIQLMEIIRQALGGLDYCHRQGVVHRDLKPANLFLISSDGELCVKVVDFGLALLGGDATRMTRAGEVIGTLNYLSPEQAWGADEVDLRTDIYAMGVILYEMCTGKRPFACDQPLAVLLKIVTEIPPRPRQVRPGLPKWLDQLITTAMQRTPTDRFGSAAQMLAVLDSGIAGIQGDAEVMPSAVSAISTSTMEYRLVSILCVQPIVGLDRNVPDPVQIAAEERGGIVHRLFGGQVMALFGLEQSHGDEALRAIQAGLDIRKAMERGARLLAATIHIEVREGLQLNARDLDRTFETLSSLPAGELFLDLPTRQVVGDRVELQRIGEHDAVQALASESPIRRRVLGVETPMVGRETELAAVQAAFVRAVDNEEPEAALVVGPPGIGKSRLRHEVLVEVKRRCAFLLEARADSSKTTAPYSLLSEALARYAGIHLGQGEEQRRAALDSVISTLAPQRDDDPLMRIFIAEVMGFSQEEIPSLKVARQDPKVMREQVAQAFGALFSTAGEQGPVCLCLEDIHWADEESLHLCEKLLERLDRTPLFVLATARPELLDQHEQLFAEIDATRIVLQALGRRPLRRLIRAVLGKDVPEALEKLISKWCDGNPYFAEELVSWMVAQEIIIKQDTGWVVKGEPTRLQLPVGIEGAIQGRLDRLDAVLKELLKAASVFGEVFWEGGCEALGFANALSLLQKLEAAEFITHSPESRVAGTSEWVFRHSLVRQVAYGMLPQDIRKNMHGRAARWLERQGAADAALLAHHFEQAGDRERAADYYARAGARALADGDLQRATEWYQTSIHEELLPFQRIERTIGLARSFILLGRYDEAWKSVESLSSRDPHSELFAEEALFLKGRILLSRGASAEAEAMLSRGLEMLDAKTHPDLHFEMMHTLFWTIWVQGRYQDAGQVAQQLFFMVGQGGRPDHLCSAKLAMAYFNVVKGDLSAAVQLGGEAVDHARQVGHPFREVDALTLLGSAQELVGFYDEALSSLQAAAKLARHLKTEFHRASIEACLGRVSLALDDVSTALKHYQTAIHIAKRLGDDRTLAIGLAGKARALHVRGDKQDLAQAIEAADRAVELALDRAPPVESEARLVLAQLHLACESIDEAVQQSLAAVQVMDRLGTDEQYEIQILLVGHDALLSAGRAGEAKEMLRRAWERLIARTEQISDESIRQSFARVKHNVRVRELWGGAD